MNVYYALRGALIICDARHHAQLVEVTRMGGTRTYPAFERYPRVIRYGTIEWMRFAYEDGKPSDRW